jgi:16S rRNA (adenine1518-N6/adenine1519-N6)-dimethyltransferase
LFKLLVDSPAPDRIVVMLQEEVALRVVAPLGALTYLGAAVSTLATARLVQRVAPGSFFPVPKVRSAIVRIDRRSEPAVAVESVTSFLEFLRAGFAQPRKQLHNSLSQGLGTTSARVHELISHIGIDSTRRPSQLALDEWGMLYTAWSQA